MSRRSTRFGLAGDSEINVVVLIMTYPRLTFHERQVLLQVSTAWRGEQLGEVLRVEDDQCDAHTLSLGSLMQVVQVFCGCDEVDGVVAVLGGTVELDVVAEAGEGAGWQRDGNRSGIAYGDKEVDRQAILVGAMRPKATARGPSGLAVHVDR